MTLPPGQHRTEGFPRFGTHLHHPPPSVPAHPTIEICGAANRPVSVALAELETLPRRAITADFHCVAGWSATGLRWEGVTLKTFYSVNIEPRLTPDTTPTHLVFAGLDGYRWTALFGDAISEDVLIADRLDGRPLDADHGAPARIVSPHQYGYVSVKHLSRIELLTSEPSENHGAPSRFAELTRRSPLIKPHRRARVWNEERHRYLPGRSLRAPYRLLIPPIKFLSNRGARKT